jgi:(R,R)-butanediol dehydrogenase/meso-butanediol dehydrogenase/diacetyl reductase
MRAVRLHGVGDLRMEAVPDAPAPGRGEARLRVTAAGVCGSDIHNWRTGAWISRAPSVAGHEIAAVVETVGPGVDAVAPGDAVVVDSRVWCGDCAACRAGLRQVCERLGFVGEAIDGGFAEAITLPARLLVRCDPALDPGVAAMAEPIAVALHALDRLAAPRGVAALVVGCGAIGGLAALLGALEHGLRPVLFDRDAARAHALARLCGGVVAGALTPGAVAAAAGEPVRWGLDATGAPEAVAAALGALAPGGALALVGIGHGAMPLEPARLVERETALIGCHAFADDLPRAAALAARWADDLRAMIGARIALADVPAAYARIAAGQAAGFKTIIEPGRAA